MKEFLYHNITMPINDKLGFLVQLHQQKQCCQRIWAMQMHDIWFVIMQHSAKHHSHMERYRLATYFTPHTHSVNSYSVNHFVHIIGTVVETEHHLFVFRNTFGYIFADILQSSTIWGIKFADV